MKNEAAIQSALDAWQLPEPITIEPLGGGFNSHTWRVSSGVSQFVAKLVSHNATFEAGLAVAEQLERMGFRAGGPLRTTLGKLTVPIDAQMLALLRFAGGEPIDPGRADDLRIWGETMGRFHSLLRHAPSLPAGLPRWPWAWLDPAAQYLGIDAWVRPAVERALADVRQLEVARPLTLGIVHGDGAQPLVDQTTGEPSVIDWGAAMWGPLLYDLASACWYFRFKDGLDARDFAPFLEAYQRYGPLPAEEFAAIDVFVRLRCAVQALYFSWRIADDIRTGLADPAENQRGLDDAHRAWDQLGYPADSTGYKQRPARDRCRRQCDRQSG